MARKLEIEYVRRHFASHGCELLAAEYVNNASPMAYRCQCGAVGVTTYGRFKRGSRCQECGTSKANSKRRLGHDAIAKEFADNGCLLLSQYQNNYTPVKYMCSCGAESEIRLFSFRGGQRCRSCRTNKGDRHYAWNPDRGAVALVRTLQRRSRSLLATTLALTGQRKLGKKAHYLGYSSADLKRRLESFPIWNDIRLGKWHIDHIFPIKAFVEHGISDIKLINCLDNLQPLTARENLKKNDTYDKGDFYEWLSTKGVAVLTIASAPRRATSRRS